MTHPHIDCIGVAFRGLAVWAAKPHNARWFRKIDGTPVPNDLPVCIAMEFAPEIAAIIAAERERCAKIAESFAAPETVAQIDYDEACHDIAEAIRKGT